MDYEDNPLGGLVAIGLVLLIIIFIFITLGVEFISISTLVCIPFFLLIWFIIVKMNTERERKPIYSCKIKELKQEFEIK
jgi:hypothetical protein